MLIISLTIVILILSAVIHEYAHGWMARRLGDETAELEGRLTLNPLKHLDPVGSVLVPILLVLSNAGFFIAWAKPVPYNPYNLTDQKFGELKVALAGPISNILIAFLCALVIRLAPLDAGTVMALLTGFFTGNADQVMAAVQGSFLGGLVFVALIGCFINLALAVFNLVPLPPLDGSKVLAAFLPEQARFLYMSLERYGLIIIIAFVMLGLFRFIIPIIMTLFAWFTGF